MLDPHDDTDVPSGSTDGAQMESTSSPVPREHGKELPARGKDQCSRKDLSSQEFSPILGVHTGPETFVLAWAIEED